MRIYGLLFAGLIGCAARRGGDAVSAISFEGNPTGLSARNDRVLRDAIRHPRPKWQSFVIPGVIAPAWLDPQALDTDAWRIEIWYANHGYFDARFLGWELRGRPARTRQDGSQRLRPVQVRGHLEEGKPSRIRTVTVEGMGGLGRPLQGRLRDQVAVAAGEVFTTDDYTASLEALRATLLEQSYAHATVTGNVEVHPADHAVDVTLRVSPGPATRFGPVTLVGLTKRTPERTVRGQLDIVEGEQFRARLLATTRSKLYAMRVFSVVNLQPDLSDPTSPIVPVRIALSQAKFRELSAGPEFEAETGKLSLFFHANWTDNNVADRLWRMEQDSRVGVAVLVPSALDLPELRPADIQPLVDLKGTVELPQLFGTGWALHNEGRVEVGLEPAYRYFAPSFATSRVYTGLKKYSFSLSYRLKYNNYLAIYDPVAIASDTTDQSLTDDYLLSILEQRVIYDGRNDLIAPTRGWYWSLGLGEAGGPFGGNYSFVTGKAELRAYRGILRLFDWDPEVVLAGRVGGGVIVPYGSATEAAVPFAERLYLGGSTSVRGWAAKRLGPSMEVRDAGSEDTCTDPAADTVFACSVLPAGGNVDLFGNFELRKGLGWGITLAAFVDVGNVWETLEDFDIRGLEWAAGAGLRYGTPIGPVRVDVALRLTDPEVPLLQRGAFYLTLAEAF